MKTLLRCLALLMALSVGLVTNAQSSLDGYEYVTGTSSSKWINISSTTNLLNNSGDAIASNLRSIGFSFPFGDSTYTQFSVNSDGNLRLGGTVTGVGSYNTPFSSTKANYNNPKINFFGCDGYCDTSIHYVHAQNFNSYTGLKYLVVEFCIGTFNTTTRSMQYKWQVQLCENGNIQVVFPSTVPAQAPAVAHQMGLCVNSQDGWIIKSNNVATHFTNGIDTNTWASGTWPAANSYYCFYRNNCTSLPSYDFYIGPSNRWQTRHSATDALNANCHKKVYRVNVTTGFTYTFKTGCGDDATADFDTKLYLYSSADNLISSNDDGCGGIGMSKIEYYSNSNKNVYLVVTGYNSQSTGNYTLAFRRVFDTSSFDFMSITPTTSYQTLSSYTDNNNPSKVYKIYVSDDDVSNNRAFIFKTGCGDGASADFDTYLSLYNSNGTELSYNDEGGCGTHESRIIYRPTESGNMYLIVRGYNNDTGNYTLSYKKGCINIPDFDYTIQPSTNQWETHSSELPYPSECYNNSRIYKTYVFQGNAYTFKTGCGDSATADFDTYLSLYDSDGNIIDYNDDGCENYLSKIVYIPQQPGYVFLRVAGYNSNSYGNYTLAFKNEPVVNINVTAFPSNGGTVTGSGAAISGSTSTVTAVPAVGYAFAHWSENNTIVSTNATYSFTVSSNRNLTAVFIDTTSPCIINSLPYSCDFENCQTGMPWPESAFTGECWSRLCNISRWSLIPYISNDNRYTHPICKGNNLDWSSASLDSIGEYRCIVLPPLNTSLFPISTTQLRFWALKSSTASAQKFIIGIMSDTSDINTFTPVDTITIDTSYWTDFIVPLSGYTGMGNYVAIMEIPPFAGTRYTLFDNFRLETIPNCPRPSNFQVTNITHNSASFTFTPGSSETYWKINYFDDSANYQFRTSDTSINLRSLQPNTNYVVSVRALCSTGDTSNDLFFSFHTYCEPILHLPYVCDFEDADPWNVGFGVECWTRNVQSASYEESPKVSSYYNSENNHTPNGNIALEWNMESHPSSNSYQCVALPAVSSRYYPINNLILRFWGRVDYIYGNNYPQFKIGLMSDPHNINSFIPVDSVRINSTLWTEYEIPLLVHSDNAKFVAIMLDTSTNIHYSTIYTDDFTLEQYNCPIPTSLGISNITPTSAVFSYAPGDNETEWLINFSPMVEGCTEISTILTTLDLTNLTLARGPLQFRRKQRHAHNHFPHALSTPRKPALPLRL